jgi:hypothetical protein
MFPTLRALVGIGGAILAAIGLLGIISGATPGLSGLWLVGIGVAGILIAAFERVRYGEEAVARSGLQPTDEVFVDPTTGKRLRVWSDPASGAREYRPDE